MAHRTQPSQTPQSMQDVSSTPILVSGHPGMVEVAGCSTTLADGNSNSLGAATNPSTLKLTLQIPAPSTVSNPSPVIEDEPDSDQDLRMARHIFCPLESEGEVEQQLLIRLAKEGGVKFLDLLQFHRLI